MNIINPLVSPLLKADTVKGLVILHIIQFYCGIEKYKKLGEPIVGESDLVCSRGKTSLRKCSLGRVQAHVL